MQSAHEPDIESEIENCNSILGEPGDLGCVRLTEIYQKEDRGPLLTEWLGAQEYLCVRLADDDRVSARFDRGQVGADRLCAVLHLQFPVDGNVPVAIGLDFDG